MIPSQALVVTWLHFAIAAALLLPLGRLLLRRLPQPVDRIRVIQCALGTVLLLPFVLMLTPWALFRFELPEAGHPSARAPADLTATAADGEPNGSTSPSTPTSAFLKSIPADRATRSAPDTLSPVSTAVSDPVPAFDAVSSASTQPAQESTAWSAAAVVLLSANALAGVFFTLEWLTGTIALRRLCRGAAPSTATLDREWDLVTQGRARHVRLLVSPSIDAPLLFGSRQPVVLVPDRLAEAGGDALRFCLSHEWSHAERGDVATWNWVHACRFILWFVPSYWKLRRELRLCQEFLADDRASVARRDALGYSELLVGLACARMAIPATGTLSIIDHPSQLTRRIRMLLEPTIAVRSRSTPAFSCFATGIAIVVALLVGGIRVGSTRGGDGLPGGLAQTPPQTKPDAAAAELPQTLEPVPGRPDGVSSADGVFSPVPVALDDGRHDIKWSAAFSPDGSLLAISGGHWTRGGQLDIWETAGPKLVQSFDEPRGIRRVLFSPDGSVLATGNYDGAIRLRSISAGRVQRTVRSLRGHASSVNGLAFSPDSRTLASAGQDKTVRLWNVATGQAVKTLEGHTDRAYFVVFSADGKRLVTGSKDKTARVWEVETGMLEHTLEHPNIVEMVALSPDDQQVATVCWDGAYRTWDAASGALLAVVPAHRQIAIAISYSKDGTMLATGGNDGSLSLWDAASNQPVGMLAGHTKNVFSAVFSPDGRTIASASWDLTARLWDVGTRQQTAVLIPPPVPEPILAVAYAPDSKSIAVAAADQTIRLQETASAKVRHVLDNPLGNFSTIAWSRQGTLATGDTDGGVAFWDAQVGKRRSNVKAHVATVLSVAFSPDGATLASGSEDRSLRLWDVATGNELRRVSGAASVLSVRFSPDGAWLASAGADRVVTIREAQSLKAVATLEGHEEPICAVRFSPDGAILASASEDGSVRLWDVARREAKGVLRGHKNDIVSAMEFAPRGNLLVSGGFDKLVKVWDIATGSEVQTLEGHTDVVTDLAFAPDGHELISVSLDRTIKRWTVNKRGN